MFHLGDLEDLLDTWFRHDFRGIIGLINCIDFPHDIDRRALLATLNLTARSSLGPGDSRQLCQQSITLLHRQGQANRVRQSAHRHGCKQCGLQRS